MYAQFHQQSFDEGEKGCGGYSILISHASVLLSDPSIRSSSSHPAEEEKDAAAGEVAAVADEAAEGARRVGQAEGAAGAEGRSELSSGLYIYRG